jgi:hypothetical protein
MVELDESNTLIIRSVGRVDDIPISKDEIRRGGKGYRRISRILGRSGPGIGIAATLKYKREHEKQRR